MERRVARSAPDVSRETISWTLRGQVVVVIAVTSYKGGVGKTTTVMNLAAALRELGKQVLVVDLDPQASLTIHLGHRQPSTIPVNCSHVLKARAQGLRTPTLGDVILRAPRSPDLVPAGFQLADTELFLGTDLAWTFVLRDAMAGLRRLYDYILIDCVPGRSLLVFNALAAADSVLLPAQASYLAVQSLILALQTVIIAKRRFCPKLAVLGVLPTMVEVDDPDSRKMVEYVRASLKGNIRVFETEVTREASFGASTMAGKSILETHPHSAGAHAYRQLAREVVTAFEQDAQPGTEGSRDGPASIEVALSGAARIEQMVSTVTADGSSPSEFESEAALSRLAGPDGSRIATPVPCPFLGLEKGPSSEIREPDLSGRCWSDGTGVLVDTHTQETTCLQTYWVCPRYINSSLVPRQKPKVSLLDRLRSGLRLERWRQS